MSNFAAILRLERARAKLTQVELAGRAGTSVGTRPGLRKWAAGARPRRPGPPGRRPGRIPGPAVWRAGARDL